MIVSGISENRIARFASSLKGQELIIAASPSRAERIAVDLSFFASKRVLVLPDALEESFKYDAKSKNNTFDRLKVLGEMAKGDDLIVVAPVLSALKKLPKKENFDKNKISLTIGTKVDRDELLEKLIAMGYVREDICEAKGQFALRGDIFDIFAVDFEYPIRTEFFDIEVDAIRAFDPFTQRSLKNISEFERWHTMA